MPMEKMKKDFRIEWPRPSPGEGGMEQRKWEMVLAGM